MFYDDCVAIYFDADVDRDEAEWMFAYVSRIWEYSLATYGAMGEERLFAIFHQGKYGGGHPSYWYDASHDNRNVADQGGNDWSEGNYDVVSHEIGHVVESTAPYPRRTSPAFGLWGDSKWAEFYQYDLYVALGMTEHAQARARALHQRQRRLPARPARAGSATGSTRSGAITATPR